MRVGIAGFAGSGKSTVFQWLTKAVPDPARSQQGQIGRPIIPDPRLDWLSSNFSPKKTTYAQLEFLDTPGLHASERKDNSRRLAIMRDAGGLLVVLNGYESGNLADELRRFREEMLFADLEVVTGRADRLKDQLKKPRPAKQKEADTFELEILHQIIANLEKNEAAVKLQLKPDEEKAVRSFQLLTLKRELVLVNIGESRLGKALPDDLLQLAPDAIQAPVKLEMELQDLSEADRQAFMQDLNITDFSRDDFLRQIFTGMGQIVFFTVGEDECRAWPMPKGYTAQEGAGEIHTDLSRGFVRAEVVSYPDFQRLGSMKEAKTHGVYRLESKTYVVNDGDIMHILAST